VKSRQKIINMQNVTIIDYLTCAHALDRLVQLMYYEVDFKFNSTPTGLWGEVCTHLYTMKCHHL